MSEQEQPDAFDQQQSRFIVGIDLGTTNCAVSYIDTSEDQPRIRGLPIEQWVDFGTAEPRDLLPSFLYEPLAEEAAVLQAAGGGAAEQVVGALARDRGLQLPGRQIASAKSWLCHTGVDRRAPILPWQGDDGVQRLSPVEASSRYLAQIGASWKKKFGAHPLAEQDIVLTLPASFDQVARQLTIEAAAQAGLPRVLPIEEPQAAFYAWLARHRQSWEAKVCPGQTILVCDIGGGTTDFTLIRIRESKRSQPQPDGPTAETLDPTHQSHLSLHRVAVGQHLVLGGDNIDLALAKLCEQKLTGGKSLPPRSWDALRQACRVAKETLLGPSAPEAYTVHLPGSGSRLIGGGKQVAITAEEIGQCVLDGFFPHCSLHDRPQGEPAGFQEFGLPFASDAAITRHLAAFLWEHRRDGRSEEEMAAVGDTRAAMPDWILFNGGVMASSQLCDRVVTAVSHWFAGQDDVSEDWRPGVLDGERLELAVAMGAAYFGQVRRGEGVKIEAKLACSYYLQTSSDPPQAVCIVPGSASPGEQFSLRGLPMDLAIGTPVQFPIVYSSTRLAQQVGDHVELDDEHFAALPPIRTVLELSGRRRRETLPVFIEVELSQIGTLQMYCHSSTTDHRWKLEFDVRGSTQTDYQGSELSANHSGILDDRIERLARSALADVFSARGTLKPSKLMHTLADSLEIRRSDWPPHLLRTLWEGLMEWEAGRRKSAAHEARWLNLLGYSLRPGYGLAADDWRVAQSWRALHGKLAFSAVSSRNEALILWRRIAGGFTAGQQLTVYQQIAGPLRGVLDPARRAKGGSGTTATELIELLRLVGSLELLPGSEKSQLGDWLLDLLGKKKWAPCQSAVLWALGRLGSRVPTYGPLNCVIDSERASSWVEQLVRTRTEDANYPLAIMLCSRRVGDRYRDIDSDVRGQSLEALRRVDAPQHYQALVRDGGQLDGEEANQILGEALPLGLRLRG